MMKAITDRSDSEKRGYRYNASVFVVCLMLSTFFWLMSKFTYQYTYEIKVPLIYQNFPEGVVLINQPDTSLRVSIKASGFGLLWYRYFVAKNPYIINVSDYTGRKNPSGREYKINSSVLVGDILDQTRIPGNLVYVYPEEIILRFDASTTRQIPVVADLQYTLARQYFEYDTLLIDPPVVSVSGLHESVAKIRAISTVPVRLENISESVDIRVPLQMPEGVGRIELKPAEVRLFLPVEKFTEAEVEVPVVVTDAPEHLQIKFFPARVKILFLVALRDYRTVNPDQFVASVSYKEISGAQLRRLGVTVSQHPPHVRIQRIIPEEVEYILMK